MPVLLRAAHVNDVPLGASRPVKIRGAKVLLAHLPAGWYAFDASKTKLPAAPTAEDVARATGESPPFRVVVRGTFVHVAMDSDRETAPASLQANERKLDGSPI